MSVMLENYVLSYVNFGSYASSYEDFGSEIGSVFGDGDDDERLVDMDGKDCVVLVYVM